MAGVSLALMWLSGLTSPVSAQSVTAYVDRNPVMADETFQLIVETENVSSGASPDWQVLDAQFDVLSTAQSQQTSIMNMQTTSRVRWMATLAPKRTGPLTIPPIRVGGHQSEPILLTVNEPNHTSQQKDNGDIFLEADVDARVSYLQGQVLLTLRLLSAISVEEGQLDEPKIEWGIVERMGKDVSYQTTRNGRRYQVTERRYLITPQESGTKIIPPVLFSGMVPDAQRSGSLFEELFGHRGLGRDPFRTSRSIHRRSSAVKLTIKDIPPDVKGRFWLPAKSLTLTETWSAPPESLQVGDPLTRKFVIQAKGQRGDQLPELPLPNQDVLKIYPDKAKIHTDFDGRWVLGSREEQHVMVPTHPGTVTLPAIHLPWWNVETSRWEEASLPARTLTIRGTPQPQISDQVVPSSGMLSGSPRDPGGGTTISSTQSLNSLPDSGTPEPWNWIAGGALAMWLVTLAAWWRDRHRRNGLDKARVRQNEEKLVSERKALQGVKAACLEQSAEQTRTALLQWASLKQGGKQGAAPCRSLGMVAQVLEQSVPDGEKISSAIWDLDRLLYATPVEEKSWDGRQFWETVKPALSAKHSTRSNHEEGLPPLYPH